MPILSLFGSYDPIHLGIDVLESNRFSILQGKGLQFSLPSRSKNNQEYVPEVNRLVLKTTVETMMKRNFAHSSESQKTAIMTRVLDLVYHYYFDNLKVFLTVIVVVHHTACAFVGTSWFYGLGNFDGNAFKFFGNATLLLNQSYFMSLFFFISGYFIPPSYDKKTEYEFMLNKSKRLGIPFYLFSC